MQNKYDAMRADIVKGDMEASSVMQKTPVETVKSILSRIGVRFHRGASQGDIYRCVQRRIL